MNSETQRARERVMADLKTLAADAEDLLRATASDAGEKVGEARNRLSSAMDDAKATYADVREQGVTAAKHAARRVDGTIREHPYESLAIALGVGALVCALLARRK